MFFLLRQLFIVRLRWKMSWLFNPEVSKKFPEPYCQDLIGFPLSQSGLYPNLGPLFSMVGAGTITLQSVTSRVLGGKCQNVTFFKICLNPSEQQRGSLRRVPNAHQYYGPMFYRSNMSGTSNTIEK